MIHGAGTGTRRRPSGILGALCIVLGFALAPRSAAAGEAADASRDLDIGNFGQVNDHLYRGAQPPRRQYQVLAALGIKTIVDLRDDAQDWARESAERAGLRYVNVKLSAVVPPTREQSALFLAVMANPVNWPVFVHCAGGRHRTGALIAVYRMEVDGWDADRAYAEMKKYKFYSAFGHGGIRDFVFRYYQDLRDRAARLLPTGAPAGNGATTPP